MSQSASLTKQLRKKEGEDAQINASVSPSWLVRGWMRLCVEHYTQKRGFTKQNPRYIESSHLSAQQTAQMRREAETGSFSLQLRDVPHREGHTLL